MKIVIPAAIVIFLALGGMFALAQGQQGSCSYCGMDREKFAHSAMMIEYEDGSKTGTCSIHCTALDIALHLEKTPKKFLVGDYGTKKVIDADKACWTYGGAVPGVMTRKAKWAFENKDDCEKFAKDQGAKVVTFDEAMKAAYEDMYLDTQMIRLKRKAAMEKGQGSPPEQPAQHEHQHEKK